MLPSLRRSVSDCGNLFNSTRNSEDEVRSNLNNRITNPKQIATTAKSGLAMTSNINDEKINIDIGSLPAGIYFVKVITNKGTAVRKFVKQ